jgi:hypothetical protein
MVRRGDVRLDQMPYAPAVHLAVIVLGLHVHAFRQHDAREHDLQLERSVLAEDPVEAIVVVADRDDRREHQLSRAP